MSKSYNYELEGLNRGLRVTYEEKITKHTKPLDAFARVFAKDPYTAIIQPVNSNDNNLYISFPEQKKRDRLRSMGDPAIARLKSDLQKVLAARSGGDQALHDAKKSLFLSAYANGNQILNGIMDSELKDIQRLPDSPENNQKVSYLRQMMEAKNVNLTHQPQNIDYDTLNNIFNDPNATNFINDLIGKHFNDFLNADQLNLLAEFNINKKLIKVPYSVDYNARHVEAKGVHYVTSTTPGENREFYIGLGKSDGQSPGCCAGCTIEFNILANRPNEQQRISVHRTADYPENLPPGVYYPSQSLTQAERGNFFYDDNGMVAIRPLRSSVKVGDMLSNNIVTLKQANEGLQAQVNTLTTQNQVVVNERDNLQQQNTTLKGQVSELQSKVEKEQAAKEDINNKFKELETLNKQEKKDNKYLRERVEPLKNKIEALTEEVKKEKEKNKQIKKGFAVEKEKLVSENNEEKIQLKQSHDKLKKLNETLQTTGRTLQAQRDQAEKKSSQLENDLKKQQAVIEEHEILFDGLYSKVQKAELKSSEVEGKLTQSEKEKEELRSDIEFLNDDIIQSEEKNQKLQIENDDLKGNLQKAELKNSQLEEQLAQEKAKNKQPRSDLTLEELISQLSKLDPAVAALLTKKQQEKTDLEKAFEPPPSDPGNQHLTRTEKENVTHFVPQGELNEKGKYNLNDRLAAVNDNQELLNKLDKEAVITANINFKAIDAKKSVEAEKTGTVKIRAEDSHTKEHGSNNQALIAEIQSGTIDKNTVIAIERKQYGENQGMKDIIKIASILEHNEKNPDNPLKLPEKLENTLIFQDALLYKTAKEKGIKVISLEGGNLEHTKESALYNENREQYMTDVINEVRGKGYNVIANVGSSHVANLEKALENQQKREAGFSNISRKLRQEALNAAASLSKGAVRGASVNKNDTLRQQPLTNTQPKKSAQSIG